jgi:hypothetical protein
MIEGEEAVEAVVKVLKTKTEKKNAFESARKLVGNIKFY